MTKTKENEGEEERRGIPTFSRQEIADGNLLGRVVSTTTKERERERDSLERERGR